MTKILLAFINLIFLSLSSFSATALFSEGDDGYRLWLKYEPVANLSTKADYLRFSGFIGNSLEGEIIGSASRDLQRGIRQLLNKTFPVRSSPGSRTGVIV